MRCATGEGSRGCAAARTRRGARGRSASSVRNCASWSGGVSGERAATFVWRGEGGDLIIPDHCRVIIADHFSVYLNVLVDSGEKKGWDFCCTLCFFQYGRVCNIQGLGCGPRHFLRHLYMMSCSDPDSRVAPAFSLLASLLLRPCSESWWPRRGVPSIGRHRHLAD